jgi:hypothetical protein
MKVLIIESASPDDFYDDQLDGNSTSQLLRLLNINFEMRIALDERRLCRALKFATEGNFDVIHLSCHGDKDGIQLANRASIDWDPLAALFQKYKAHPRALVMSSCCGAASGIGYAFAKVQLRPNIIFGSTDERYYHDYAVAWAILYRVFLLEGVHRDAAQQALAHINAVVSPKFKYRRWDDTEEKYLIFPGKAATYGVVDVAELEDEGVELNVI